MIKLNEQLVYNLKGRSIKDAWELVKTRCILNFYKLTLEQSENWNNASEYSDKIRLFFLKNYKLIESDIFKIYQLNKVKVYPEDILFNNKQKEYNNPLFKIYYITFNDLYRKNVSAIYNQEDLITININSHFFIKATNKLFDFIIRAKYYDAKNLINYNLKIFYSIFKHELIHFIDDKVKWDLEKYDNDNNLAYILSEIEFPTLLSDLYNFFKRTVVSARKKITYKKFFNYLLKSEVNPHYSDTIPNWIPRLRDNDKKKWENVSKRLFILLKKYYLEDDGTKIPTFLK